LPTIKGLPERIKAVREVIDSKFQFELEELLKPVPDLEFSKQ
jgi:hypothetical protein